MLVHGFTQTHRSWDPVAARLAPYRRVVRVDLPAHGASAAVRVSDVGEAALVLGETCGTATYVGYSMGGRVCLRLAVDRPELVRALVLVSTSPGIEDEAERAARREADDALAARIEREGLEGFLRGWLAQPMFEGLPPETIEDRRRNTAEGLAAALRAMGPGAMEPLWDRLGVLVMPIRLITGERDPKYIQIAERMRSLIPAMPRIARVSGAGHAAHLEAPEMVSGFIESFLVRHASVTS